MKILFVLLTTLFTEANIQYAEGNYAEAASTYEQILANLPSTDAAEIQHSDLPTDYAVIYYNLGNAYFKQGELAQSILAYERALRLKPSMKDAKHNLLFAQSQIIDNIEDTQSFFLSNWFKSVRDALSQRTWNTLSISLFILALVGFFFFAFSRTIWLRKTAFYLSILALIISIGACANAGSLYKRDTQRTEAIVTQGVVNAKASPDRSGTELFTIHEGTKVKITETIGDWCCIHVGNNIGWIPIAYLERI